MVKGTEGGKPVSCLCRAYKLSWERRQLIKLVIPTKYGITTKFKALRIIKRETLLSIGGHGKSLVESVVFKFSSEGIESSQTKRSL